jgi:leader peptidase (prepilin peptidase)/N-methyltransferase
MILDIYIMVLLFILGLVMGSFFSVVGTRVPKNESIVKPRSHCENCNHILKWYELIPIISYVIQRGRCTKCKTKLSLSYPLIELLNGFLFSLSYALYGFSYEMMAFIIISSILILVFVSDFNYMIILDEPLIIGSILILGMKLYFFGFDTFTRSIYSGLIMFIFMLFIKLLGDKAFKRESLGGGDIKLVTFFGFVFGVRLSLASVVFGSFFAFPYAIYISLSKKDREVPFGPFLIAALLIVFIYMEPIKEFMDLLVYGI